MDLNYVIVEKLLKLGGESESFHLKFVGLLTNFPQTLFNMSLAKVCLAGFSFNFVRDSI